MTDSKNSAGSQIPDKLQSEFAAGRVIPFIGSGVSRDVNKTLFPTWGELLNDMEAALRKVPNEDHADLVKMNCRCKKWLDAAKVAREELGQNRFHDVMLKRFDIPEPTDANWSLPDAIWGLKPRLVITTNYDDVLVWRNRNSKRLFNRQIPELARLLREATAARPWVWHLHGHISDRESLILAPS